MPLSGDDDVSVDDVIAVEGEYVCTWNFAGLCSERKQREVGQVVEN